MKKIMLILFAFSFPHSLSSQSDMTDYEKFVSTPNTIITKMEKHVNAYPNKPMPFSVYLIKVIKNSQIKIFVKITTPKYSSSGKLSGQWYSGIFPIEDLKAVSLNMNKFFNLLSDSVTVNTEISYTTPNWLTVVVINNHTSRASDHPKVDEKRALIMGTKVKKYDPDSDKYVHIYLDKEKSYLPIEIMDFDIFKNMFDDIFKAASSF